MSQRIRQGLTAIGLIVFALYIYGVALFHPTRPPLITRTFLDDYVPYWPGSIWIYLSPYVLAPLLFAFIPRDVFLRLFWRVIALLPLQLGCFFVITTGIDRPPAPAGDDPTSALVRALYALDSPPLNAAPSAHVSLALLMAWGAWRSFADWRARVAVSVYAVAVVASVVLTGQHHVVDIISAAALVVIIMSAFALGGRFGRGRLPRPGS